MSKTLGYVLPILKARSVYGTVHKRGKGFLTMNTDEGHFLFFFSEMLPPVSPGDIHKGTKREMSGTLHFYPLFKGDREIRRESDISVRTTSAAQLLDLSDTVTLSAGTKKQTMEGLRFLSPDLQLEPAVADLAVEDACLVLASMGHLDMAFMLVLQVYCGFTVRDLSKPYKVEYVLWDTYPGQGQVKLFNPSDGNVIRLSGVASQTVATWWSVNGGYHGDTVPLAPVLDYLNTFSEPNTPFTRCGHKHVDVHSLPASYRSEIIMEHFSSLPLVTQEVMDGFDGRWCVQGGVVYVEEDGLCFPYYTADPALCNPKDKKLETPMAWSQEWCDERKRDLENMR